MKDFLTIIQSVLEEQNKSTKILFEDGVISKNTFYKYKQRNPNLKTLIKLADYLKVSIDYMYELSDENKYRKYSDNQTDFYNKLITLINAAGISQRKFCKDLHYAKDNISTYKNEVIPNIQTLLETAEYFGCTIDYLLTKED